MENELIKSFLFEDKYEDARRLINRYRKKRKTWDNIIFACKANEEELIKFLKQKKEEEYWDITLEEWYLLVDALKNCEKSGKPGFIGEPKKNLLSAPSSQFSHWVKYIEKLKNNGFSYDSISNIEISTTHIVTSLSDRTERYDPVRGMVVGNVQSGKTANMAALIAMAADYGYNFFIVLTGTIENLRRQTRDRLIEDLINNNPYSNFTVLDKLSDKTLSPNRLQDLNVDENSRERYLTVCLKNPSVLRDLLYWLNMDQAKKSKLKVLLIDDEADQAGINTANISKNLVSTINGLIKKIVFAERPNSKDSNPYMCMNYVGYTATPYPNFLNEANNSSLYPKNFIALLTTPGDYFGPYQIFGLPDENDGLPILNTIEKAEIDILNDLEYVRGMSSLELINAIYWFICTVAVFRYWKLKRPVSMLIHTSQKVEKHDMIKNFIQDYFDDLKKVGNLNSIIDKIEGVWNKQTSMLTLDVFKEQMPDHPYLEKIKDYPDFLLIRPEIERILSKGIKNILLDDERRVREYSDGLHLCVDNFKNNIVDENVVMRIIYPDKQDIDSLEICPAFIVIGGSTLSRGLTLEGLTCSYFIRTTSTADTLMQMGRWFGYRKGYELLPRIWLSKRAIEHFKRLTILDCDLREELRNMEMLDLSPSYYGPKLKTFPDLKTLKITSKNKMQSAMVVECSFLNKSGQTILFHNDDEIINQNFGYTYSFINNLGDVDRRKIKSLENPFTNDDTMIWFDVDHNLVLDYLGKLKYPSQKAAITDMSALVEWFKKEYSNNSLKDWNIVLSNIKNGTELKFNKFSINLPTRTKLKDYDDNIINIKTLTDSNDKLVDIDCSKLDDFDREGLINNKGITYVEKRLNYGRHDTPLLIIYIIDKDSGKGNSRANKEDRVALNINQHLVGYYIFIPYGSKENYIRGGSKVTVKLDFDWEGDVNEVEN